MKKLICILLLAIMLLGLAACDKPEVDPGPHVPDSDTVFDPDTFVLYSTVAEVFERENVTIKYPQMEGLFDKSLQEDMNSRLQYFALSVLEAYEDSLGALTLEVDYEVTRSTGNLLSVVFRGLAYVEGAAHPNNIVYTVNIDIQVGIEVVLADMVILGDEFIEIFRAYGKTEFPEADEYVKENDNEYFMKEFRSADSFWLTDTYSYYTEDAMVICFSVPQAIGGYAEFRINYEHLDGVINDWRM
ncbi:MAG: DUF4163 domain-containing protein [Oscillospiraceae bacterium]|nr:DUF4163 domain-containing protein [Oscillospiraceae bacterium]